MANSVVKTAVTDEIRKTIDNLPADPLERLGELGQTRWDVERALELVKHNQKMAALNVREERDRARFLAMRSRIQESFGFGMSTPKAGPVKQ